MHSIVLYSIVLHRSQLYSIVLLIYCFVDIIQYNAMHKIVRVLDNPTSGDEWTSAETPREWSGDESTPGTFQDGGSLLHLLYSANCPLRDESGKNQLTEIRLAPHVWHFHAAVFVLNFALLSFRRDSFSLARIMRKPAFVCWRLTGQNPTTSCFSTIRCVLIHCSQLFCFKYLQFNI